MRFLVYTYATLVIVIFALAAVSYARAEVSPSTSQWPSLASAPSGYFYLKQKGHPTLICAEWNLGLKSRVNCHILHGAGIPWPPAGLPSSHSWQKTANGVKEQCFQWDDGKIGLAARCDPVVKHVAKPKPLKPGEFAAKWWVVDGSWGRA